MRTSLTCMLLAIVSLSGCVIDTVPLPEGRGDETDSGDDRQDYPDSGAAQIELSLLYYTDTSPALVAGLAGAVPPSARILVLNPHRERWQGETQATSEGSFNLLASAVVGDTLEINVEQDGAITATAWLQIEAASTAALAAGASLEAAAEDTVGAGFVLRAQSNGDGTVTVSAEPGILQPDLVMIVANLDGGDSARAVVQQDGGFEASLAGGPGDEVAVFAVDPQAASAAGGVYVTLFVD